MAGLNREARSIGDDSDTQSVLFVGSVTGQKDQRVSGDRRVGHHSHSRASSVESGDSNTAIGIVLDDQTFTSSGNRNVASRGNVCSCQRIQRGEVADGRRGDVSVGGRESCDILSGGRQIAHHRAIDVGVGDDRRGSIVGSINGQPSSCTICRINLAVEVPCREITSKLVNDPIGQYRQLPCVTTSQWIDVRVLKLGQRAQSSEQASIVVHRNSRSVVGVGGRRSNGASDTKSARNLGQESERKQQ